jgi:hypothetical protein
MNQGILIYAHNSRVIDYIKLAAISGGLAKKYLKRPVSLVTDESTLAWAKESKLEAVLNDVFEHIIVIEKPELDNQRNLYDGDRRETVPFFNANRPSAYEVTPYDQTLLIDCDYFVFSDVLNNYWELDLAISQGVQDVCDVNRMQYHDNFISDTGVKMYWATCVMFKKNETSKAFFDLVASIKKNYLRYSDIYRFDSRMYRNDISFSLAKHIFNGFIDDSKESLPKILTTIDKDILYDVDQRGKLKFLISTEYYTNYVPVALDGVDVHIMNKQSIIRNFDNLIKLI